MKQKLKINTIFSSSYSENSLEDNEKQEKDAIEEFNTENMHGFHFLHFLFLCFLYHPNRIEFSSTINVKAFCLKQNLSLFVLTIDFYCNSVTLKNSESTPSNALNKFHLSLSLGHSPGHSYHTAKKKRCPAYVEFKVNRFSSVKKNSEE